MEVRLLADALADCGDGRVLAGAAARIVIAFLVLLAGCTASVRPLPREQATKTSDSADAWTGNLVSPTALSECKMINPVLVNPVQRPARAEAIARLEREPVIPLDQSEADWMTGITDVRQGLKPFLVRGVAKNEATGRFDANLCGDLLYIHHASLGASDAAPTRLPVVVFLDRAPTRVVTSTAVVQ